MPIRRISELDGATGPVPSQVLIFGDKGGFLLVGTSWGGEMRLPGVVHRFVAAIELTPVGGARLAVSDVAVSDGGSSGHGRIARFALRTAPDLVGSVCFGVGAQT